MSRWLLGVAGLLLLAILLWLNPARPTPPDSPLEASGSLAPSSAPDQSRQPSSSDTSSLYPSDEGRPLVVGDGSHKRPPEQADVVFDLWVEDEGDQLAIPGVRVELAGPDDIDQEEVTDINGHAGFVLEAGEYQLRVNKEGYLARQLKIGVPAGLAQVQRKLQLTPVTRVQGRVLDQYREPVRDARVSFIREPASPTEQGPSVFQTQSDKDGRYLLNIPPGDYQVQAEKKPHPVSNAGVAQIVLEESANLDVVLPLREDLISFRGQVSTPSGDPIPGASVRIGKGLAGQQRSFHSTRTDSSGFFALEVWPEPETEISITASGFEPLKQFISWTRRRQARYQLKPLPTFQVGVYTWDGQLVENPQIYGENSAGERVLNQTEERTFYSTTYPVQIFADALESNQGISSVTSIEDYQPSVRLIIEPGGELRGRVVASDSSPIRNFILSFRTDSHGWISRSFSSEDGSFYLRGLPAGTLWVRVSAAGFRQESFQVSIETGRLKWLEVSLLTR